jgi:Mg-chelatase subunit ChlD
MYPLGIAARGAVGLARAPRAALRLAQAIRSLDLRRECLAIRAHRIPVVVIGCKTDTLVRCEDAEVLAETLGADYVELDAPGGHMWMLSAQGRLAGILAA